MAKLPTIKPDPLYAFFMRPEGCTGSEALIYVPSYNPSVRAQYARAGLVQLSQVDGDFTGSGEDRLRIGPPTGETTRWAAEELQSRAAAVKEKMAEEIDTIKMMMDDKELDSDERKLYRQRYMQMKKRLANLDAEIPTFKDLTVFFAREHTSRVASSVPGNVRAAMAAMEEEAQWNNIVREAIEAPEAAPKRAKRDADAVPA